MSSCFGFAFAVSTFTFPSPVLNMIFGLMLLTFTLRDDFLSEGFKLVL